ncbi:caveolae-associated protein 1 [Brachyhypopomus gauderio]|uniref:caveolae-associated protein 1 n=1 Tax=Brachyhypopomus gauderio TaxID=698409 RepID=UPI00404293AF
MADTNVKKAHRKAVDELSSSSDDDEVALVTAATKPSLTTPVSKRKATTVDDSDEVEDEVEDEVDLMLGPGVDGGGQPPRSEAQDAGVMVLALLDKIIGAVDHIQLSQDGLEARQGRVEKTVSTVQTELTRLAKNHSGTAATATKLLGKVRKVNVCVKGVRAELDRQAGQIKKLENNEQELLKRKNFKMLIIQEKPVLSTPPAPAGEEGEQVLSEGGEEARGSDEEVEIEEIVEESRAARIKRSGLQRVDELKKAFSKEQMEKTRQKTRENLEKTRQRTRENLEKTRVRTRENLQKTRQNLGKKMGKLSTRITPNTERKEKIRSSRDKLKKSLAPGHSTYTRSKTTTYRVPPFTFYVKKIREGETEPEPEHQPEAEPEAEEEQWEEEEVEEAVLEGELVDLRGHEGRAVMEQPERLPVLHSTARPRESASH